MVIRVGICEDDPVFLRLMAQLIGEQDDMELAIAADSKKELLRLVEDTPLDVLLLDLNLSEEEQDGLEAAFELQRKPDGPKLIVLSSLEDEEVMLDAVTFGRAANYVTKKHFRDVPDAIRQAYAGTAGLHHSSAGKLVQNLLRERENGIHSKVSRLQVRILELLDQGCNSKQIAEQLFYSQQTIHNELSKLTKLLKGSFPYLAWLQLKRHDTRELVELARKLKLLR